MTVCQFVLHASIYFCFDSYLKFWINGSFDRSQRAKYILASRNTYCKDAELKENARGMFISSNIKICIIVHGIRKVSVAWAFL
jgi:hypothetical protein